MNDNQNRSNTSSFIILSALLAGFVATIWLAGYFAALVFCAIGAGFVLWWSARTKR